MFKATCGVAIGACFLFDFVKSVNDDGTFTDEDKSSLLQIHNEYRSKLASGEGGYTGSDGNVYPTASDMAYLSWDDDLESVAQGWSDTMTNSDNCGSIEHNDDADSEYGATVGENVGIQWHSSSTPDLSYYSGRLDDMWLEYKDWYYQSYSSSTINGAGHFTQMAWANTEKIGCAGASCVDSDGWNVYYLTCNYYPAGNYRGYYPYTEGTCSSSTCDGECQDGLCVEDDDDNTLGDDDDDDDDTSTGDDDDTSTGDDDDDDDDVDTSCEDYSCIYLKDAASWDSWGMLDGYYYYAGCYGDSPYYAMTSGSNTYYIYRSQTYTSYWFVYNQFADGIGYNYCYAPDSVTDCNGGWNGVSDSQTYSCDSSVSISSGNTPDLSDDDSTSDVFSDDFFTNCTNSYGDSVCMYNSGSLWDGVATFTYTSCYNNAPMFYYTNANDDGTTLYVLHYSSNRWIVSETSAQDDEGVAYCENDDLTQCQYDTWYVEDNDVFAIETSMGYDANCDTDEDSSFCDTNNACAEWQIDYSIESSDTTVNMCKDTYVMCVSLLLTTDYSNVYTSYTCEEDYHIDLHLNVTFTSGSHGYDVFEAYLANYTRVMTYCVNDASEAYELTIDVSNSDINICDDCDFSKAESSDTDNDGDDSSSSDGSNSNTESPAKMQFNLNSYMLSFVFLVCFAIFNM